LYCFEQAIPLTMERGTVHPLKLPFGGNCYRFNHISEI